MNNEPIIIEWLQWYGDAWRAYEEYLKEKKALESKLSSISGIDYSKDKIKNGSKKQSEEERFILKLEKRNKEIQECEKILFPAKARLIEQIKRIPKANWRKVLILYYVERWKLKDITEDCFWYEKDYETNKDVYLATVKRWKREAVQKLTEISQKPYVKVEQLTIGANSL